VRRTSATAFSAEDGEYESPSDIPVAAPARGRNPFWMRPEPLPPPPRQRRRLSRLRMPSTDECSLGPAFAAPRARARHPDQGFCHPGRASDASSPPANGRLDTAAFADSSPASARRHAPLVDFCNQTVRKHDRRIDGAPGFGGSRACAREVLPARTRCPSRPSSR
jgi:hypothetical protein